VSTSKKKTPARSEPNRETDAGALYRAAWDIIVAAGVMAPTAASVLAVAKRVSANGAPTDEELTAILVRTDPTFRELTRLILKKAKEAASAAETSSEVEEVVLCPHRLNPTTCLTCHKTGAKR
jgi:hypothetical protein